MPQSAASGHISLFAQKMEQDGLDTVVIDTFAYYYDKILTGETGLIYDRDITPVAPDEIQDFNNLAPYAEYGRNILDRCIMIVLNGGLGTGMGLTRAKSLLNVKDDLTFLDIITKQSETDRVRLGLMNSFSTDQDTITALKRLELSEFPILFLQHKFPKILKENLMPARWEKNPKLEWNPPGHGDIYTALLTSGTLDNLLDDGITYAFISNSDNLGAVMNESLLGYFAEHRFPFMMEVADRTPTDAKGGHLARHASGRLILRESAQCPQDETDAFRNITRYRYFNTNNIWINLEFLKRLIESRGTIPLPMILNKKTLDPRDPKSPEIYQIETAMGSAVSLFEGATAVRVPRSRFFPVKKCSDLLLIRSDCFFMTDTYRFVLNPKRRLPNLPTISLDPEYYGKIDDLDERFRLGIPSLLECESLSIEGNVFFEGNVSIKGTVRIRNPREIPVIIDEGTVIQGDLTL